ncbi:hypothetical protein BGX34_008401 [Mortierella sp. NVP85]|nr:hypothetical protein BGX34_008401 [Mortierella sp. NVP85]
MKRKAKSLKNDQAARKKKLLHFQRVFCDPPDAEALLQQNVPPSESPAGGIWEDVPDENSEDIEQRYEHNDSDGEGEDEEEAIDEERKATMNKKHRKQPFRALVFQASGSNQGAILIAAKIMMEGIQDLVFNGEAHSVPSLTKNGDAFAIMARELAEVDTSLLRVTGSSMFALYHRLIDEILALEQFLLEGVEWNDTCLSKIASSLRVLDDQIKQMEALQEQSPSENSELEGSEPRELGSVSGSYHHSQDTPLLSPQLQPPQLQIQQTITHKKIASCGSMQPPVTSVPSECKQQQPDLDVRDDDNMGLQPSDRQKQRICHDLVQTSQPTTVQSRSVVALQKPKGSKRFIQSEPEPVDVRETSVVTHRRILRERTDGTLVLQTLKQPTLPLINAATHKDDIVESMSPDMVPRCERQHTPSVHEDLETVGFGDDMEQLHGEELFRRGRPPQEHLQQDDQDWGRGGREVLHLETLQDEQQQLHGRLHDSVEQLGNEMKQDMIKLGGQIREQIATWRSESNQLFQMALQQIDLLQRRIEIQAHDINDLSSIVDTQNVRLVSMTRAIDGFSTSITRQETNAARQEAKLDSLSTTVRTLSNDVRSLKHGVQFPTRLPLTVMNYPKTPRTSQ